VRAPIIRLIGVFFLLACTSIVSPPASAVEPESVPAEPPNVGNGIMFIPETLSTRAVEAISNLSQRMPPGETAVADPSKSLEYYNSLALATWCGTNLHEDSWTKAGDIYFSQEHAPQALSAYSSVLACRHIAKSSDHSIFAHSALRMAQIYNRNFLTPAASDYLLILDEELSQLGTVSFSLNLEATLFRAVFLLSSEKYLEARHLLDSLKSSVNELGDEYQKADFQNNYAHIELKLHNFSGAKAAFADAVKHYDQVKDDVDSSVMKAELASLLADEGDFQHADSLVNEAMVSFNARTTSRYLEYVSLASNIASVYQAEGRYDDALTITLSRLQILRDTSGDGSTYYGFGCADLGGLLLKMHRPKEARDFIQAAIDNLSQVLSKDSLNIATLYSLLGRSYHDEDNVKEAGTAYLKSLAILNKPGIPPTPLRAWMLNNVANLFQRAGDWAQAEQLMTAAISQLSSMYGIEYYGLAEMYDNYGALFLDESAPAKAIDQFQRANAITRKYMELNWARGNGFNVPKTEVGAPEYGVAGEVLASSLIGEQFPVRRNLLADAAFTQSQWIGISESAMAISLTAARTLIESGPEQDLLREVQIAAAEITLRERGLSWALTPKAADRPPPEEELATISSELQQLHGKLDSLRKQLGGDSEKYMQLSYPAPLSVEEVKGELRDDEVLLYYFSIYKIGNIPESTFIWVVNKFGDPIWVRQPIGAELLRKQISTLRCGLDRDLWKVGGNCDKLTGATVDEGDPLPFRLDIAFDLYQELVEPIREHIQGKHIILVTGKPLSQIPFQVFVTRPPASALASELGDYGAVNWLAGDVSIDSLPSVASLRFARKFSAKITPTVPFAGFGAPSLAGQCPQAKKVDGCDVRTTKSNHRVTRIARVEDVKRLCPLPETEIELRCIADVLGGDRDAIFLGDRFTKETLRSLNESGELAKYKVIDFATHGILPVLTSWKGYGNEAALVATPSKADDGVLTASEIAKLRINADWVILAACNTGSGTGGLTGLANAFFFSGARGIIISHWETDSLATVRIATGIAAAMSSADKKTLSDALRTSLISLISGKDALLKHPSVWAPFVVVGDDRLY
jgi:CHAT domain-containing protein/tetratricopeptide (TPR) repeat protein